MASGVKRHDIRSFGSVAVKFASGSTVGVVIFTWLGG